MTTSQAEIGGLLPEEPRLPTKTTDKFTRLSDQVYLLQGPKDCLTEDITGQHGPDLILLFGWGDASLKHVAKFADGFRILFPRAKIILVLAPIFKALFSSQDERMSCVQPLIEEAFGTDSTAAHIPGKDPSVLVHVLSSTGCLYFTATLEAYRNAFGHVMPHSLLVMDSTPGSIDHSPSNIGRLADALAVDARSKVPWPPQVTKVMCIMILYLLRAMELARSRENLIVVAFKMANDETFETKSARRLYIYSKEDRTTAWEAVEKHADEARELGYTVDTSLWEGSGHVEHMRKSPEKYWTIIGKAWEEATGSWVLKARL
ncbi:indole-diterpene biosynthesis protein [Colletotrichum camelliae]|nr:indole-diterpene biosynthesis protein [Colletotrichum camelliae]